VEELWSLGVLSWVLLEPPGWMLTAYLSNSVQLMAMHGG